MTRRVNFNFKRFNARKALIIHLLILTLRETLIDIEINISEVTHLNCFNKDTLFTTKSQSISSSFCLINNIVKENKKLNVIKVMNLNFNK